MRPSNWTSSSIVHHRDPNCGSTSPWVLTLRSCSQTFGDISVGEKTRIHNFVCSLQKLILHVLHAMSSVHFPRDGPPNVSLSLKKSKRTTKDVHGARERVLSHLPIVQHGGAMGSSASTKESCLTWYVIDRFSVRLSTVTPLGQKTAASLICEVSFGRCQGQDRSGCGEAVDDS